MEAFNIGDHVVVTHGCEPFFSTGDVGYVASSFVNADHYLVDFSGAGNARVYEDGVWYCMFLGRAPLPNTTIRAT